MKNAEKWKDIRGYEGLYQVSNFGNVRSIRNNIILKPYLKNGYLAVHLVVSGRVVHKYVHRLVAEHYIENPNNQREVNHLDCDKRNNDVTNLEWCDRKRNLQHSYDNGLKRCGEKHGCHKLSEYDVVCIRTQLKYGISQKTIAEEFGVKQCTISAIKRNKLWKGVI